ncbi:MAG: hypothetical protein ACP6IP_04345 [Candidatus Njordarchaeia archaeon]
MKWIIVLTEGTRDSIFLKLIMGRYLGDEDAIHVVPSYVKSTVPKEQENFETYISGAYIIETQNYKILLIPLQGSSQLAKFYESIKNDIQDPDREEILVPTLTKLETNRINKNELEKIILVFDKDRGREIIEPSADIPEDDKLIIQEETIRENDGKQNKIVKLVFNQNLEEFILEEMIKKTTSEEMEKIRAIIEYLQGKGFNTSKAVKSALYIYCNNYIKQYLELFKNLDRETLENITNQIAKMLLEK